YLIFFFSSRRRHTRSKRDWSSDVCSSDLFENSSQSAISSSVYARRSKRLPKGSIPWSFNCCIFSRRTASWSFSSSLTIFHSYICCNNIYIKVTRLIDFYLIYL